MQSRSYPTWRPTPTPAAPTPAPEPALHLLGSVWVASCPSCGFQLATARTQQRCEQRAARRTCPICREES